MGIINVLDFQVANLIAAGEVVERPASCVKELLENALDAGATDVVVEIKRGGVSFLRVTDNGCGIAREDLPVALKRHATSKIRTAADLDGIMTLGFRGEALAAIASVSVMRIMTKRPGDKYGSLLMAECGKVKEIAEVGAKNGTTVIVENLFANVPARRKFLKRDASEGMAVTSIVEKLALSRPDVAFRLILDGATKFSTPGDNKLISAVYGALGKDFADKLMKVRNLTGGVEVVGYVSRPESVRANRNGQNFFINGRYVRSKTATAALEQAFDSYLEAGKFPACVLFIQVHPTLVDVNVHPTKLEVKFSNERAVFDAVYCAVRNALSETATKGGTLLEPRRVTPSERGLYNAFVPVEDKLEDTPTALITKEKVFDTPSLDDLVPMEELTVPKSGAVFGDKGAAPSGKRSVLPGTEGFLPPPEAGKEPSAEQSTRSGQGLPSAEESPRNGAVLAAPPVADLPRENLSQAKTAPENMADDFLSSLIGLGNIGDPVSTGDSVPSEEAVPAGGSAPAGETTVKGMGETTAMAPETSGIGATVQEPLPRRGMPDGEPDGEEVPLPPHRIIGIAFHAYIIVEVEEVTLIIDKHAAHERILFEKMKKNRKAGRGKASQMLLLPLEVGMTREELDALCEYRREITSVGFDYTAEERGVVVTEIPLQLSAEEAQELLTVMAGQLAEGTGNVSVTRDSFYERALYQASCKAAMKAGIIDTPENIRWLVETVLTHPQIRYCPHGRPIAFELSKRDMEKFFKRT